MLMGIVEKRYAISKEVWKEINGNQAAESSLQ